jgi:hypothetical protein
MQTAANYAERYAAMSDSELAGLVSGDLDSLNEEARSAFHAELRKRGLTLAKLRKQYPPEPPSNEDERNSRGSLLQEFGFFGIPVGGVLALILYASLANWPFGIQVATLVACTSYVFTFVFCNVRSSKGYDLRQGGRSTEDSAFVDHPCGFSCHCLRRPDGCALVATIPSTFLARTKREKR